MTTAAVRLASSYAITYFISAIEFVVAV